jgi:hypothetical protein
MSKWSKAHFKAALRILIYLYQTRDRQLIIRPTPTYNISVYCDANYGDERDGGSESNDEKWKSQGGYLLFVGDSLVSWRSRRHKARSLSSMESEYMEASEAAKEIVWFRELLSDVGIDVSEESIIYEDNKSCIAFSSNNTSHDRTKHIDIHAYWLRDHVRSKCVKLLHVDTENQLADMMTKYMPIKTFVKHTNKLYDGEHIPPKSKVIRTCISECGCISCFLLPDGNA